jgi:hypothetical protein
MGRIGSNGSTENAAQPISGMFFRQWLVGLRPPALLENLGEERAVDCLMQSDLPLQQSLAVGAHFQLNHVILTILRCVNLECTVKKIIILSLVCVLFLVSGCGHKGPLYFPGDPLHSEPSQQ